MSKKPMSVSAAGKLGGEARVANMTPAELSSAMRGIASKPRKPNAPRCECKQLTLKTATRIKHQCTK